MDNNYTEIVASALTGNKSAYESIYNLTKNSAYSTALAIVKNEQDAMDVLHDSYIKAFEKLGNLKNPETFETWFNKIVANTAKNYLKKKRPVPFSDVSVETKEFLNGEETNREFLPQEFVDKAETRRLIKDIVDRLPDDQRTVVTMYYYREMSVADIADSLQLTASTVKYKLFEARKKIKAEVEKQGGLNSVVHFAFFNGNVNDTASNDTFPNSTFTNDTASTNNVSTGTTAPQNTFQEVTSKPFESPFAPKVKLPMDIPNTQPSPNNGSYKAEKSPIKKLFSTVAAFAAVAAVGCIAKKFNGSSGFKNRK